MTNERDGFEFSSYTLEGILTRRNIFRNVLIWPTPTLRFIIFSVVMKQVGCKQLSERNFTPMSPENRFEIKIIRRMADVRREWKETR